MTIRTLAALLCVTTGSALATSAEAGDIRFYAKNGCVGPVIFRYPTNVVASDNCKTSGKRCSGKNDEARSVWMPNAGPWSLIVYDSPDARTDDDYAEIKSPPTPHPSGGVCVSTFEPSASSPLRKMVTYHRKNGLDGKVSHIAVNSIRLR